MDIRTFAVDDDTEFRAFYEAFRDGQLHERPDMPMWSEHDAQVAFRRTEPDETMTPYVALDDGRVVGAAIITVIHNSNTDKAFLDISVPPQHRGRGIGTALERHLAEIAVSLGRSALVAEAHIPIEQRDDHAYRRFAERRGYALANVEIKRALPLPVPAEPLDRWEADAAPHHRDYRIETYVDGAIPDELIESYCDLIGLLALEAPTGDLEFEPEVVTVEAFKLRQAKNDERGTRMYATVAIDHEGAAVAHSVLAVPRDDTRNVYQWGTLVRRDHRGHRLGLATKVRNLRVMQASHPGRVRIVTQNGEVNGPMVAINELLGFVPIELSVEFQRFLSVDAPQLAGAGASLTAP